MHIPCLPFFASHTLHSGIQFSRLLPSILSSLLGLVATSHTTPTGKRDDDASAIILRAKVFGEIDNRLGCSGRVVCVSRKVNNLLIGDHGRDAVCDEYHVAVVSAWKSADSVVKINHALARVRRLTIHDPVSHIWLGCHPERLELSVSKRSRILKHTHPPRLSERVGDRTRTQASQTSSFHSRIGVMPLGETLDASVVLPAKQNRGVPMLPPMSV